MKRIVLATGVVVVCAVAAFVTSPLFSKMTGDMPSQSKAPVDQPSTVSGPEDSLADVSTLDEVTQRYINEQAIALLEAYGETIQSKRTQAMLLDKLSDVLARYPDNGWVIFASIVQSAFPDYAAEILVTVKRMAEYEYWLAENQLALSDLSVMERNGALWTKRRAMFGDDAAVIWADEQEAWNQKQQQVKQAMQALDQSKINSLDETLFQLKSTLDDTYGAGVQAAAVNQGVVAQAYFGFESVQSRLRTLSPEARQQKINDVRRQIGYSDAQVANLAKHDARREKRWNNGNAYMEERNKLAQNLKGAELDQAVADLRQEYFEAEAQTIRKEEDSGFFRYERPRLYGRN
ncbi:hypothetical protein ACTXGQ_07450 [Marinobacter sp. 1Y8]